MEWFYRQTSDFLARRNLYRLHWPSILYIIYLADNPSLLHTFNITYYSIYVIDEKHENGNGVDMENTYIFSQHDIQGYSK